MSSIYSQAMEILDKQHFQRLSDAIEKQCYEAFMEEAEKDKRNT